VTSRSFKVASAACLFSAKGAASIPTYGSALGTKDLEDER